MIALRQRLARWRRLPRDKADTLLLLLSCVMVLLPHTLHLPLWVSLVVALVLLWRTSITLQGSRLPPFWLLLPPALLALGGVYLSFQTLLGRDAGVAMLALLLGFKLLEMHAKRDLYIIIFISFFLLLSNFFYSQSIATALSMVLTIILLLTAQLSFQYTGSVPSLARRLRLATLIFAAAAPLALVLFVTMPRIQGPLWGRAGAAAGGAHTGLSDSMTPGDIAQVANSEEIVFRVRFDGAAPAQKKLYWRGLVFGDFDGRSWTRSAAPPSRAPINIGLNSAALHYQVTLEPHGRRWLYALDVAERLYQPQQQTYTVSPELEFLLTRPVTTRVRYEVDSVLNYHLQADLTPLHLQQWLELPPSFNPRTLALAADIAGRSSSPEAAIEGVLDWLKQGHFLYTLQPPLLGKNSVDDFLFETRSGFCEHYAGAFVVLMRALDIPARVIAGYQGGEVNPVDGYLTLRQSDAHAWAEVWLAGRGWVRIDPTAAVAPQRVARNLASALPPPAPFGSLKLGALTTFQGATPGWLTQLRFDWNAVNNSWNQWVLDYSPERQRNFLHQLHSNAGSTLGAAALGALLALALAYWLRVRGGGDPVAARYQAFCRRQAKRGYPRAPHEGPHAYALRLAETTAEPEQLRAMTGFLAIYGAIQYGVTSPAATAAALPILTRLLGACP